VHVPAQAAELERKWGPWHVPVMNQLCMLCGTLEAPASRASARGTTCSTSTNGTTARAPGLGASCAIFLAKCALNLKLELQEGFKITVLVLYSSSSIAVLPSCCDPQAPSRRAAAALDSSSS
jgi:hypothetical protein